MKISDKTKGLVDYTSEYDQYPDDVPEPEYSEEEEQYLLRMYNAAKDEQAENEQAQIAWEAQGEENLQILLKDRKQISERISYILDKKHIDKTTFARQLGVGRTTMHRYTHGEVRFSKKKLLLIIDELYMDVADFCYEPTDIEKWKAALEEVAGKQHDIYFMMNRVLGEMERNDFTYIHNGEVVKLPYKYYALLKSLLHSSFRVLDIIPHDKTPYKPNKPKAPVKPKSEGDSVSE